MRAYLFYAACLIQVVILFSAFKIGDDKKEANTVQLLYRLTDSLSRIHTATYKVENKERIGDQFMSGSQYIFYQKQPFQCKVEFINPNKGSQVVFGEGRTEATYSPLGFPYFDMDLNPLGSLMRRNNHHTIYEVGFEYVINIIKSSFNNSAFKFNIVDSNDKYITISVINSNFKFVDYKVKEGEDIRSIAMKRHINEYLILEKNEGIDFYDDVSAGDIIKIPNSYAKEVKIVINSHTFDLKDILVYDNDGLFEEYHYREIQKNIAGLNFQLDN